MKIDYEYKCLWVKQFSKYLDDINNLKTNLYLLETKLMIMSIFKAFQIYNILLKYSTS